MTTLPLMHPLTSLLWKGNIVIMFMGMNITYFSFLISGQMTFMILQSILYKSGGGGGVALRLLLDFLDIGH